MTYHNVTDLSNRGLTSDDSGTKAIPQDHVPSYFAKGLSPKILDFDHCSTLLFLL